MEAARALVRFSLNGIMEKRQFEQSVRAGLTQSEQGATSEAGQQSILPSEPVSFPAKNRLLIILSLLALYTLWGGTYLGMRIALEGFPPFFVAAFRQFVAGVILY